MRLFGQIRSAAAAILLTAAVASGGWGSIRSIRTPDGGQVPEVVYTGVILHLTYGKDGNAYYARSQDDGKSFAAPVRLNRRDGTVTVGGERGPKVAIGKDGVIHVVWLGHYQKGGGVWYTRSTDEGRTFSPERNLLDKEIGTDGATIAADSRGHVTVFWIDGWLGPDKENPVAGPIFMTRSSDNGATWSANERVRYDFPGRACACCRLEARFGPDGFLYLAFRTGYHNVRDFYMLCGPESGIAFHAVRVSEDNWVLEGCPMMGAPFTVDSQGRVLIAWMSQGKVYWSRSGPDGERFAPRQGVADREGQRYPIALNDGKGSPILLWRDGGVVKGARAALGGGGRPEPGTIAEDVGSGKFAAFVDRHGDVCVVL